MKRLLGLIFWLALFALGGEARAQSSALPVAPCVTIQTVVNGVTQYYCNPVGAANPLPVTGSSGGGSVTQGTTPWVDAVTQWGSTPTNLGLPTAWGVSPSGNVIGANAYVISLPAGTIAAGATGTAGTPS